MSKIQITERDPIERETMLANMTWNVIARNPQMDKVSAFTLASDFVTLQDRRMSLLVDKLNAKVDEEEKTTANDNSVSKS